MNRMPNKIRPALRTAPYCFITQQLAKTQDKDLMAQTKHDQEFMTKNLKMILEMYWDHDLSPKNITMTAKTAFVIMQEFKLLQKPVQYARCSPTAKFHQVSWLTRNLSTLTSVTCLGRFLEASGLTMVPWSAMRYAKCLRRCVSTITSVKDPATCVDTWNICSQDGKVPHGKIHDKPKQKDLRPWHYV